MSEQNNNNESSEITNEPFYIYKEHLCIKLKYIKILLVLIIIGMIEYLLYDISFVFTIMGPLLILGAAAILLGVGIRMIVDDFILKKEE